MAAALVHKAVGDQLTCFFIDHGSLRAGEREQAGGERLARQHPVTCDESEKAPVRPAGVTEPEAKGKIITRVHPVFFEAAYRSWPSKRLGKPAAR